VTRRNGSAARVLGEIDRRLSMAAETAVLFGIAGIGVACSLFLVALIRCQSPPRGEFRSARASE
jgi:hypothetical protein